MRHVPGFGCMLFVLLCVVILGTPAWAQTLGGSVLGNGGASLSGGENTLMGTAGQAGVGLTTGPPASNFVCSGWWCVEEGQVVDVPDEPRPPLRLELGPTVPNPTKGPLTLALELPIASVVDLTIFDVAGKRVRTLARRLLPAGSHKIVWNGRGAGGSVVQSGVYLIRLEVDGRNVAKRKVIVAK